jgi:hypothetical protein
VVISAVYQSGSPWLAPEQQWSWRGHGGLSIYAPLHQDEAKRRIYYNQTNLAWARDTQWDEFLETFWADQASRAAGQSDMPICQSTVQGCQGLANPLPMQLSPLPALHLPIILSNR